MEFKQPNKKRKINFSDPVVPAKPVQKKGLKWFEEDKEWQDLWNSVKASASIQKPKKGLKRHFSKSNNPFDDPTKITPKNTVKLAKSVKNKTKKLKKTTTKNFVQKNKVLAGVVCLVIVSGILLLSRSIFNNSDTDIAGVSNTANKTSNDLPRETPKFKILYPGNKDSESVGEIVRVSPDGSAPAYTYGDKIGEVQINVSQQELPPNFKINQDGELEKLAEGFQAKNIIQVDSIKVYHGSSSSGVQSLIFIKGNLLFTVRASQKISDETWAAYISALHS